MDINLVDENVVFVTLIVIADIYLGCWVYLSNKKSNANRQFLGLTLLLFLWALFCYEKSILPAYISIVLVRSAYAVVALFFALFHFFLNNFPKEGKTNRIFDKIILCVGAFLALFSFDESMVEGIIVINDKNVPALGDGRFIYLGLISLLILFITVKFFRKYRNFSKVEKLKAEYFFIGFVIFIAINFVFNIAIPVLQGNAQYSCLGNHAAIFFLVLTAYAIVKRELMDIETLLAQMLVVIISFLLFLDIIFFSNSSSIQVIKIGILLIFIFLGKKLVKSVKSEIEAKEKIQKVNSSLKERNQDLHTLFETSNRVSQSLDSKKISQDVVDSIPKDLKYLGYAFGVIALYDKEKDCLCVYAVTDSALMRKMEEETQISISQFRKHLSTHNNLIIRTIKDKKTYVGDNLEDFFSGLIEKEKNEEMQKILKVGSFVSVPLFSSRRAIGAIIFANEKQVGSITERSKDIICAFASHIGSSIENAQLYEKTNSQMKEKAHLNISLRKANIKLNELLEMKNEFLHITSHQLRTPMTAIRGMISMWIEGDFDKMPKKRKGEMLSRIYASAERLNNITNDMLDALEFEGGVTQITFQKVNVVEIINGMIETLKSEYDKRGLYLRLSAVKEEIPEVEGEANYLGQVFMNLIDNACKYTRKGGVKITVKAGVKYVYVSISDTGIGIDREDKGKIFDKFTRGKNAMTENASGSGLGLFVVKKILDEHNGKIAIKSNGVRKGTTFEVSLLIKQK
ncbi:MAG: GAF domain-containing sensor histidine kinase [Candidatus Pacebacteria bacterium]|nr:GAF domain-containing sensor histidine kinase [Candidatus Paceibacterota bacterium]